MVRPSNGDDREPVERFGRQLLGPGNCGTPKANDISGGTQNGRCGFGPRLPLLVVSPWAKPNFIDEYDYGSIVDSAVSSKTTGTWAGSEMDRRMRLLVVEQHV